MFTRRYTHEESAERKKRKNIGIHAEDRKERKTIGMHPEETVDLVSTTSVQAVAGRCRKPWQGFSSL